jgi:phosphatidylserine/phosphatidylglycerophosphate/cardiolipin synthase-like enzyme
MTDPRSDHSWIEPLFECVAALTAERLTQLADLVATDGLDHSASRLQRALSLATPEASNLARALAQIAAATPTGASPLDASIALRAFALNRASLRAQSPNIEIVCTAPDRLGVHLRTTFATAREMIRNAEHEILIAGYAFTEGASDLIDDLAVAARQRSVAVTLIGNRMRDRLPFLRSHWPADVPSPRIFSREADPNDEMAALHAKIIICDRSRALVTSANFSRHGLHENIEIGVSVRADIIGRMADFLNAMIVQREVEPLQW